MMRFIRWCRSRVRWWARWILKIDWELIDVCRCEEHGFWPKRDPYSVEVWKCKRTGEIRFEELY